MQGKQQKQKSTLRYNALIYSFVFSTKKHIKIVKMPY